MEETVPLNPAPEAEETERKPEPISLESALSWLAAARPAAVLSVLRDPEFAFVSMTAFAGFRVNTSGYASPLVRRRLGQEILQNDKFAEKIRALAAEAPPISVPPPAPKTAEGKVEPARERSREDELRTDRDQRRRERDEARAGLRRAEEARAQAEGSLTKAEETRDSQERLIQQQAQRIARLERQVARMQTEQAALLKALRQDKVSSPPRSAGRAKSSSASSEATAMETRWREAVSHLLSKGKNDTALGLALDVLRADAEEVSALEIATEALQRKGEAREAAQTARRLLSVRLAQGEPDKAADALFRLLLLLPTPMEAGREVRQWLTSLRSPDAVAVGRAAVERLRVLAPAAHQWLAAEVRASVPALADELMPAPGEIGPDDPLPLGLPGEWSARRLLDAVNANKDLLITHTREALAALNVTDAETAARVWAALTRAAEEDDTALAPLRRVPRGAVVVDGSNAAWFDQHSYSQPRARLRPLLELRRALRRRGYFPVLLYADAPLPYTVDDADTLRAMLGRGEISLVDSGVDADEVLLREAKRHQAPLVTNDYMNDWDPEGEVEKIQYTISLTGEAHLLS